MDNNQLYIPVVLGTVRPGSNSAKVALVAQSAVERAGYETQLVDLAQLNLPPMTNRADPSAEPWREIMRAADGVVMVVPEYNHSYPGALKDAMDFLGVDEHKRKPVGICTVSSGAFGGARMAEHLVPLLVNFGLVPIKNIVHFREAGQLFDASGQLLDEKWRERVDDLMAELGWYARTLRYGRDNF